MPFCDTCSFPVQKPFFRGQGGSMHSSTCDKCVRLATFEDLTDKQAFLAQPQCPSCGKTFPRLYSVVCGQCTAEEVRDGEIDSSKNKSDTLPPFTQPGLKSVPPIQTKSMHFYAEDDSPTGLSPVNPPAITPTAPSEAALRVIDRAADHAIGSTSDRLGNKIKFRASSVVGLLSTQIEQARKVKAQQNTARRALEAGTKSMPGKGKNKVNKVQEVVKTPTLLVVLKSAVIPTGSEEKMPVELKLQDVTLDTFEYTASIRNALKTLMGRAEVEHEKAYKDAGMPYGPYPVHIGEVKFQIPSGRGFLPTPEDALSGTVENCVLVLQSKKMAPKKRVAKVTFRLVYNAKPKKEEEKPNLYNFSASSPCPGPTGRFLASAPLALVVPSPDLERLSLRGSPPLFVREVSPAGSKRSRDERNGSDESDGEHEASAPKLARVNKGGADQEKASIRPPTQVSPQIVYKRHPLLEIRTTELTKTGEPYQTIKEGLEGKSILVAKYWAEDKEKEVPAWMGAYLNNGYYKQGVKGIYGGQHVAIMQCLRKATHTVSEETNLEHLSAELSALVIAQEATENMIQFAEGRMIKLPNFSWNVDGAFIGRIPLAEGPNQVDPLPFEFMLIVPLLDIKEEDTIRFNIPVNTHPTWSRINMADALNAFLHFSYLQSDRKLVFADLQGIMQDDENCVMFDPQFSTLASVAGPWDRGIYGLRTFERDHMCSTYCRRLGLDLVKKDETLPPRPKPRPRVVSEETNDDLAGFIDPALLQVVAGAPASDAPYTQPEGYKATESQEEY